PREPLGEACGTRALRWGGSHARDALKEALGIDDALIVDEPRHRLTQRRLQQRGELGLDAAHELEEGGAAGAQLAGMLRAGDRPRRRSRGLGGRAPRGYVHAGLEAGEIALDGDSALANRCLEIRGS